VARRTNTSASSWLSTWACLRLDCAQAAKGSGSDRHPRSHGSQRDPEHAVRRRALGTRGALSVYVGECCLWHREQNCTVPEYILPIVTRNSWSQLQLSKASSLGTLQ
jgi:hypothetical protein